MEKEKIYTQELAALLACEFIILGLLLFLGFRQLWMRRWAVGECLPSLSPGTGCLAGAVLRAGLVWPGVWHCGAVTLSVLSPYSQIITWSGMRSVLS